MTAHGDQVAPSRGESPAPVPSAVRPQWTERDVALPRLHMHLRELPAHGAILVLLHGLSVDGSVWQGMGRRLSPPYRLVAPDLRGHGFSDHPEHGYSVAEYVADIAELTSILVAESGEAVHVLGHSLGAMAALGAAALQPALVDRLVLVDPPLDGPLTLPSFLERMLLARSHDDRARIRTLILEQTPGLSESVLRVYERMWNRVADGAIEAVIHDQDRTFRITDDCSRVGSPTLILRAGGGGTTSGFSDATADEVRRRMPNVEIVTLPTAGHAIHAEQPAEFARLVRGFLGGAAPGSRISPTAEQTMA